MVVNLGDTFDTHAVVRSEVMCEFIDHVKFVTSNKIPYVYILGNHDMYKPNDAKYHALKPFKGLIDDFTIIDEVQDIDGITYVPFLPNPDDFPKIVQPIVVCHQTFIGADYGTLPAKDGVMADSVETSLIISGHIHKRQSLNGKVIYPGSPFSQSASDIDQSKGLMLFDTETYAEKFIPCPLPKWHGLKYEITAEYSIDQMHEDLSEAVSGSIGDHWVIEITGPRAEIVGYMGSKRRAELLADVDVKIKTYFTDSEKRTIKIKSNSMEDIVSEYATKIYSGSVDRDLIRQKAIELLEKARAK